ncbi:MAG TPA: hypothetical protein VNB59_04565 [Solirubrobacterales bacterium]|jgi:hypothetical protein|nr:hypothetical protein [Solirubrobacterales bacterium]
MALRDRAEEGRRLLDRYLFPESPANGEGPARWEKAALTGALLALAIVLQLVRIGWTGSLNALWAEDGPIFVQSAVTQGFGHAIGSEYSGYLVLVPRLIAELATLFPLEDAAASVSILSAAVVASSGLAVWYAASGHIADPYLRGTLVLLTVLTPVGGLETLDSASYVSWYMLFAVFWILLWRPRTLTGAILGGLLAAAAVLSNPGAWFFLPVAALRAFAIRDRRDATIVAAYFAASAVQLVAMLGSAYEGVEPLWTSDIWKVLVQRVVDGAAFGLELGGTAWAHLGWAFLIVLTLGMVAAFAVGLAKAGGRARAFALVALPTAIAMFALSVYQRAVGPAMLWPAHAYGGQGGRYSIVPVLLVVSAAMIVVEGRRRQAPGRRSPWLPLALVGLLLVSAGASFSAADTETRGTPHWDTAVDEAASTCASQGGGDVTIPTSPPGFEMSLPCKQLPSASSATSQR